jgi:8-oxo-dGTP diphosphatase
VTTTGADAHPVAKPVVAAGVVFVDDAGRLMMVRPSYKTYWDIPGGYVETGETPKQACVREVKEELGLDIEVGSLLSVDWAPHPDEGDKVLFIFDGGQLTNDTVAAIRYLDGEIAEHMFVAADGLGDLTIPRLSRRLQETLTARAAGRPAYLEDGLVSA